MTEKIKNTNPVITLKTEAQKIDFSDIRAGQDNKLANSGETMFLDLHRMNFIINGKKIDRSLLLLLKGGANNLKFEDCLSEILSKDLTTDTDKKSQRN
ncbi:hypothetical protein [Wolbachia endosymbiont of Chironomus riparius]|uniref:hypothetical protein n=1 Tax=Wolbachia endosymbiont of Chironomus riparius TaxID=2883238 RepID=UPI00209CB85A|nr:hypothetical protein [Wolbachia endosymbiont of Chironomus riparius]